MLRSRAVPRDLPTTEWQHRRLREARKRRVGVGTSVYVTNSITGPTVNRVSNSIAYFTPKVGGFFGEAQYYFGENASNAANKDDGTGYGVCVGYGQGPWEVAAATSRTQYLAGDSRQSNIGGSYDFGFARILAVYAQDEGLIQASAAPALTATTSSARPILNTTWT